jgi:hypothetical protein
MHGFCATIESPDAIGGWEDHVMKVLTKLVNGIPEAAKKALVSLSLLSKINTWVHLPTGSL